MSKRSPKSVSEKLEIVLIHLGEGKSLSWSARNHGVSKDKQGSEVVDELEESYHWKKYSKELKEQGVSD